MSLMRPAYALAALILAVLPVAAQPRDDLAIGMTQFPATMHPSIESMLAKSYVLAMARRPFTVYDPNWQLICMLCVELPTLENGGAVRETTPDGKPGIAVTYTIRPDAVRSVVRTFQANPKNANYRFRAQLS